MNIRHLFVSTALLLTNSLASQQLPYQNTNLTAEERAEDLPEEDADFRHFTYRTKLTMDEAMMYYCLVNCDDGDPSSRGKSPSESFVPGLKDKRKEAIDE